MDNRIEKLNLGPVSAYAIARKWGYAGTEEEWAARIAHCVTEDDLEAELAEIRGELGSKMEAGDVILKPAVAGAEGQILQIVGGKPGWSDVGAPTDEQVADAAESAVNAWLAAHPDVTTTVEDGAVSRAKLSSELQQAADTVDVLASDAYAWRTMHFSATEMEKGSISGSTHENDPSDVRARTKNAIYFRAGTRVYLTPEGYKLSISYYSGPEATSNQFVDYATRIVDEATAVILPVNAWYRFLLGYANDATVNADNLADLAENLTLIVPEPKEPMIAPTETSATAAMAHAAGQYFVYAGELRIATDDIAQGGTIVTDGNSANCRTVPDGVANEIGQYTARLTAAEEELVKKAPVIISATEVSGRPVMTLGDATEGPIQDVTVRYLKSREGSGTATSENVRAIRRTGTLLVASTGKNLCGGDAMRDMYLTHNTLNNDKRRAWEEGDRRINGNTSLLTQLKVAEGIFKPKTAYTFIMTVSQSNANANPLKIVYEGGSELVIPAPGISYKATVRAVSDASKSVKHVIFQNAGGSVRLYVDESGIFEGGTALADFEPYRGTMAERTLPNDAQIVEGYWNPITGRAVSTWGYYASYSGQDLPGEWISSMDEYEAGVTPTAGAEVAYELAEPVEYELEPVLLRSVNGPTYVYSEQRYNNTEIQDVVYYADTRTYIDDGIRRINAEEWYTPDIFPQETDAGKLNAAFEELYNVGGNICINREYVLDADVYINNHTELENGSTGPVTRKFIHVFGIGKDAKIKLNGHRITADGSGKDQGGVFFHNMTFVGDNSDNDFGFDASKLIRLWFSQCNFYNLRRAFSSTSAGNGYAQTLYFSQCVFKGPENGTAIHLAGPLGAYNIGIYQCIFENLRYGIYNTSGSLKGVRIDDSLFEGIKRTGIYIGGAATNVTIANGHFEICHPDIYVSANAHSSLSILNNYMIASNTDSIIITPYASRVKNHVMGIIQGNYHAVQERTRDQVEAGLVNFATLTYDDDDTPRVVDTMPKVYQPWVIQNNTPNKIRTGGPYLVGSANKLESESDLDAALPDGVYSILQRRIIVLVYSVLNARLQVKFLKPSGQALTEMYFRTQAVGLDGEGNQNQWTPWMQVQSVVATPPEPEEIDGEEEEEGGEG